MNHLKQLPPEQLREILSNQLDLEIRLKHKELELTQDEISKIEAQMVVLRKFFDVPNDLKLAEEPADFTNRYINTLSKSLEVTINDLKNIGQEELVSTEYGGDVSAHGYRTRSTTSSLRPTGIVQGAGSAGMSKTNLGCLYRRTDGIIVRLSCPDCHRSNFSSAQGFLNHSRIAHSKEYTSQDAAALKCGEILPMIKQDPEGEASLQNLLRKNLDPSKNLSVNEIYFDGLSNTLNTVHEPRQEVESVLMKKAVKKNMGKEEYERLVADAIAPVENSHLFHNEVDDDSDVVEVFPEVKEKAKMKRRTSRGGIKIQERT